MTQSTDGHAITQLIDLYCSAWNDPDPVQRRAILAGVWAEGASYTDPTVEAIGIDALLSHIEKVRAGRPGAKVMRTSTVDAHHDLARFAWRVVQADGTLMPEGIDIAELTADGKLRRIIGFFGSVSAL